MHVKPCRMLYDGGIVVCSALLAANFNLWPVAFCLQKMFTFDIIGHSLYQALDISRCGPCSLDLHTVTPDDPCGACNLVFKLNKMSFWS